MNYVRHGNRILWHKTNGHDVRVACWKIYVHTEIFVEIDKPLCNDLGSSNTQSLLNNFMMIRVKNDLIRYVNIKLKKINIELSIFEHVLSICYTFHYSDVSLFEYSKYKIIMICINMKIVGMCGCLSLWSGRMGFWKFAWHIKMFEYM